ncbi:iron chelate uptake ABC transporter family permease subunit [Amycolatopsis sp. PS_44_ISF1]|uniref:FecCD family ABC transporter permease n=1 Tax=Amycolatopsis sp. PS_44_ISF1 TaxID=2974917 RepID=UPI0028DEA1EE|nr:iron chelate uptake ABC transporter family permease subunit [Amycolatopsis sp. PS_44_ISF1]MDT8913078.1 iron ABC transporter permease [Amycolatopsis sp. PS_44_ISF1]
MTGRTAPEAASLPGVFRAGRLSLVWRPWPVLITAVLLVATLVAFCLSIGLGEFQISIPQVLATIFGQGDRADSFVIMTLRLPRALIGLVVGLALGISGALTQSIARNPLASPDVLGVTSGAGTAAVLLVTVTGGAAGAITASIGLPAAALAGGLGTGLGVYVMALRRGIDGFRLLLIGVSISAVLEAITNWLLVTADIRDVGRAQGYLVGSLDGRSWTDLWPALIGAAGLVLVVLAVAFQLKPMHFGDDVAAGLGVRLPVVRAVLLLCAVLLAGVAVSAAGPVPFVALVAPQVAMRLLRFPTPPLVASGLCGALLVLGSDLIARTILPVPLPVGIVTATIGGPFLVFLLVRANLTKTAYRS